jgi:hypothetical protein
VHEGGGVCVHEYLFPSVLEGVCVCVRARALVEAEETYLSSGKRDVLI